MPDFLYFVITHSDYRPIIGRSGRAPTIVRSNYIYVYVISLMALALWTRKDPAFQSTDT